MLDQSRQTQKLWKKIGLIDSSIQRNSSINSGSSKKEERFPSIRLNLEQMQKDQCQPKIIIFNEDKKVLTSKFHQQRAKFDKNDSKQFIKAIEQLDIEISEVEEFDTILKDPQQLGGNQNQENSYQMPYNDLGCQFKGITIKPSIQIKIKKILLIVQEFKKNFYDIHQELQNQKRIIRESIQASHKYLAQIFEKIQHQREEKMFLRQKLQFLEKSIESQAKLKQENRALEVQNRKLRNQMTKSMNLIESIKLKNQNQYKVTSLYQKQKLHKKTREYQTELKSVPYQSKVQQKRYTPYKNQYGFNHNRVASSISPQTQKIIDRVKTNKKSVTESLQKISYHAKTLAAQPKQRMATQYSPSKFYHTITRESNINKMKLIEDRVNRLKTQIQTSISALKT